MPTEDLVPDGVGTYNQWTENGGSGHSIMHDSNNATFISCYNCGRKSYSMGNMTSPDVGPISKLTHIARASESAANAGYAPFFRYGGTNDDGAAQAVTTSWLDYAVDFPTAPGGGPWSLSIVNSTEVGVLWGGGVATIRVSEIKVRVHFSLAVGGFALFVSQWLPPLIAVASHALMKREIAEILSSLRVRPSSDFEFRKLLEAFGRRPAFVFVRR